MLYHYPTTWNHVLIDHATTFLILPISANETALTTKWPADKDAVEGEDYDLKELIHVWTETNHQDRKIVEENVRGIHSPAYEPVLLIPRSTRAASPSSSTGSDDRAEAYGQMRASR